MIDKLQSKLVELRTEREKVEMEGFEKIEKAMDKKNEMLIEIEKKKAIIQAKEREFKLNYLKIREI